MSQCTERPQCSINLVAPLEQGILGLSELLRISGFLDLLGHSDTKSSRDFTLYNVQ